MADKRVRKAVTTPRLLLFMAAKTRADTLRSFYDLSTPILGNTHLGTSDLMVKLTTKVLTKRSQMTYKIERGKLNIFSFVVGHTLSNRLAAVFL